MIKYDLHMHTNYCDGSAAPEEYVKSAIEKGLSTIGFSVHSYVPFDDCCIAKEKINDYVCEISSLKKKYKDKISILCGVEQDYYSEMTTEPYDYVIGSVHYLKVKGNEYIPIDLSASMLKESCRDFFDGDFYELCDEYYRTVSDVCEKTGADIIGHLDLVTKFNDIEELFSVKNERYVNSYTECVKQLCRYNKPFEINTGAMSRGYKKAPYPSEDLIKIINSLGGSFIMSSDSHCPENIAYEFNKYEEWAKSLGAKLL